MHLRSAAAIATLLGCVACSSSTSVRDCSSDADCGDGNLCHQGACAANAPPAASLPAVAATTTHRLFTLTGSGTDPERRPVTLRWAVRAIEGGCEPDVEPVDGTSVDVICWCAGRYEASAVPADDLGLEGAPAVQTFEVTAAVDPPSVITGRTIAATHACDGAVPACAVLDSGGSPTLSLGAAGTDPSGTELSYEWTVFPPPGVVADGALAAIFEPSAGVALPTVTITNAGGPIAGTYRFRVRARNPQGLVAQGIQEVTVANSAPVLRGEALAVPHRCDGIQYLGEGEIELGASDPDGDLLRITSFQPSSPVAGCTEEFTLDEVLRTVRVRISCASATSLLGEAQRTLTLTIDDRNGGTATAQLPLTIANRAPIVVAAAAAAGSPLAVDHRVEPCILAAGGACFVSDGTDPFTVSDPDGDPLGEYELSATVGVDRPSSIGIVSLDGVTRRFRFETPTTSPLEFRSATGASGFLLTASVKDPWGVTGSASIPLAIGNRAPIVKEAVTQVSVFHAYDAAARRYAATASGSLFEDPDGDPLLPSAGAGSACSSVTLDAGRAVIGCARPWDYALGGVPPLGEFATNHFAAISASDGWATAEATTAVTILDRPATIAVPVTTIESCECAPGIGTWKYRLDTTAVRLPALLADPDGDPACVSLNLLSFQSHASSVTCLPGWCYPTFDIGLSPESAIAFALSNWALPSVTTAFTVTVTCSKSGTICTP
ncbi:MAG: hypothetical protein WCC48_00235 [Anaeromyxobacteraceae bacterium]